LERPKRRGRVSGGDVGNIGRSDRDIGAGEAGDGAADEEQDEARREGQKEIVDRRAGERDEEDRPAAEPIAEGAEHRREHELHRGIERRHRAEEWRDAGGAAHGLEQPRQDGKDQADADGIEHDGRIEDGERPSGEGRTVGRGLGLGRHAGMLRDGHAAPRGADGVR